MRWEKDQSAHHRKYSLVKQVSHNNTTNNKSCSFRPLPSSTPHHCRYLFLHFYKIQKVNISTDGFSQCRQLRHKMLPSNQLQQHSWTWHGTRPLWTGRMETYKAIRWELNPNWLIHSKLFYTDFLLFIYDFIYWLYGWNVLFVFFMFSYQVYFWEYERKNETEKLKTLFLPDGGVKLKNLTGFTTYMVSVAPFNAAGDGPRSPPTRGRTQQAGTPAFSVQ